MGLSDPSWAEQQGNGSDQITYHPLLGGWGDMKYHSLHLVCSVTCNPQELRAEGNMPRGTVASCQSGCVFTVAWGWRSEGLSLPLWNGCGWDVVTLSPRKQRDWPSWCWALGLEHRYPWSPQSLHQSGKEFTYFQVPSGHTHHVCLRTCVSSVFSRDVHVYMCLLLE